MLLTVQERIRSQPQRCCLIPLPQYEWVVNTNKFLTGFCSLNLKSLKIKLILKFWGIFLKIMSHIKDFGAFGVKNTHFYSQLARAITTFYGPSNNMGNRRISDFLKLPKLDEIIERSFFQWILLHMKIWRSVIDRKLVVWICILLVTLVVKYLSPVDEK